MPALLSAEKKLDTLDKKDITELKSMNNPPSAVEVVFACVMTLFAAKKTDWQTARNEMGNAGAFLDKLKSFDKDHVPAAV